MRTKHMYVYLFLNVIGYVTKLGTKQYLDFLRTINSSLYTS